MHSQTQLILPIEEKRIHILISKYFAHLPLPSIQLTTGTQNIATICFADYKFIYASTGDPKIACQNLEHQFLNFLRSLANRLIRKYAKITKIDINESQYFFGESASLEQTEESLSPQETRTAETIEARAVAPQPQNQMPVERRSGSHYEQVREHCMQMLKPFPEYTIEKQNGVFICRAEFEGVQFASKYFVEKMDAQEDVCKGIVSFIENRQEVSSKSAEKRKREESQKKRQKENSDLWEQKKRESKWMRRSESGKTVVLDADKKSFWEEKKKTGRDYRTQSVVSKGADSKKLSFKELFED